jgi:hypothetical protein
MTKTFKIFIIAFAVLAFCATGYAATKISSLPYTIKSSGYYEVVNNLSISAGIGITIDADNVTLYGAGGGKTITYAKSGKGIGIMVEYGVSNLTIYNLTLTQSSAHDKSVAIDGGPVTKTIIRDSTINIKSAVDRVVKGISVKAADTSSYIQNNVFNISGKNRFYGIGSGDGPWRIQNNRFNVSNHSMSECGSGSYPYVIYVSSDMVINANTFNLAGGKVNGIASYGADNVKIYDNNFVYNSTCGGRLIFPDAGAEGWEIYDNYFKVIQGGYVIRIRGTNGNGGSNDHKIHNNTIDATKAQANGGIYLISLGGKYPSFGNKIYNNYLKGSSDLIDWYGITENTTFSCNTIEHIGTSGYAVNFDDKKATKTTFARNDITTKRSDGNLVHIKSSDSSIKFCDYDITSSQVTGGGSVSISSSVCNSVSCSGSGADLPEADSISAPENLHVIQ